MNLTLSHQAKPSDDVLFQEVGGEAVLLKLGSETYFGLDAVGTRIWILLNEEPGLKRAFDILSDEYEVETEVLERDLLALVDRMAEAGLLDVS
jgi:hypothetical protein